MCGIMLPRRKKVASYLSDERFASNATVAVDVLGDEKAV
jgi:hypothetical protein